MLGDASYSEKEMKLFAHFGMADIAYNMQPPMLYTMLAYKAFVTDDQTMFAAALRRCLVALENVGFEKSKVYRCTPEWDALIGDPEECQVPIGADDVCGLPSNSQIHVNYANPQRHDFGGK
jgi:hypothetical protein